MWPYPLLVEANPLVVGANPLGGWGLRGGGSTFGMGGIQGGTRGMAIVMWGCLLWGRGLDGQVWGIGWFLRGGLRGGETRREGTIRE